MVAISTAYGNPPSNPQTTRETDRERKRKRKQKKKNIRSWNEDIAKKLSCSMTFALGWLVLMLYVFFFLSLFHNQGYLDCGSHVPCVFSSCLTIRSIQCLKLSHCTRTRKKKSEKKIDYYRNQVQMHKTEKEKRSLATAMYKKNTSTTNNNRNKVV